MTHKMITFEFVAPTALALVLGTVLLIGAIYLTNRSLGPVDQSEANHSVAHDGRAGHNLLALRRLRLGLRKPS